MRSDLLSMDLTDDQKKQVEELFSKAKEDLASQREQAQGKDPADLREHVRATMQALREKVGNVLNDKQRQELRRKLQRAGEGIRDGGAMMAERIKAAMKSIELTDEQKLKLDALLKDSQSKMQQLDEQTRMKLRELMKETGGKIDELLTPEQREKFKGALPEGPPPRGDGPDAAPRRRPEPPADRL